MKILSAEAGGSGHRPLASPGTSEQWHLPTELQQSKGSGMGS